MSNPQNPVVAMIRRIRTETYKRIYRGELKYESDIKIFENHIQIAEQMNNVELKADLFITLGIVNLFSGYFDKSIEAYQTAYTLYESIGLPERMAVAKSNSGEVWRTAGDYQKAVESYQDAVNLLKDHPESFIYYMAQANMGLAYLALDQNDKAEKLFNGVLKGTADVTWEHVSARMESSRGLAEVYLQKGDFKGAWTYADAAEELALGNQNNYSLVEIYLTKAHLADLDTNSPKNATEYYHLSRQLLSDQQSPVMMPRALMDEARYQFRAGHQAEAKRLAQEAQKHFTNLNMLTEAALAAKLAEQ